MCFVQTADNFPNFLTPSSFRKWIVRPVKDATYLCDIGLELEVIPLQFEVAKRSLRRWLHSQVPDVVQHVVARSVELEQAQLQAPRFLPALETTFGANFERSSGPEEKKGSSGGPLGYLGLSELPLRLRDDGRDYESGTVRRVPSHNPGYASVSNPVQSSGTGSKINGEAETMTKGQDEVRNTSSVVTDGSVPPSGRWFIDDDDNLSRPGASEVHMRRFDTDTTLHRRALGAVRIEAPPDVVYRLLTNFESMPNFIPNLALTERVDLPFSLRNRPGRTRLRQVFLKCHLYHLLQTGITLDVVQKDDKGEIQFRVLDSGARGEILQGKWLVVPCPAEEDMSMAKLDANDFARGQPKTGDEDTSVLSISLNADEKSKNTRESRKRKGNEATILKFAIEGRALRRRSSRGFWLSSGPITATEARDISLSSILPERAVFEEVLLMLHSAREYFQATFQREQHASSPLSFHPDIPYMSDGTLSMDQLDDRLSSLRSQMLALGFGTDGVMPRRAELRDLGAYSIEQAIVNAGGFDVVAKQLGWTNNRKKPRGYWSNLVNVEREVLSFIVENDLEPGVMPSRPQLEELGRRDIAKSLARHGGSTVIAEKIGLVARRRPRKSMTSIGFPEKKNGNLS